tara:strand:- start:1367 stop:1588 length:222 start_codon:yes stop_codon:yes gene_type:complete
MSNENLLEKIEHLERELFIANHKIEKLQYSEFKLEEENKKLQQKINETKNDKKLINSSNHILFYNQLSYKEIE